MCGALIGTSRPAPALGPRRDDGVRGPARGDRRLVDRRMSTRTIVLAVCLGLAAGVLSGLFGVGGGILFVPTLVALGLGQVEAAATSLLAIIPTAAVGTWRQARYGNLRVRPALILGRGVDRGSRARRPGRDLAPRARSPPALRRAARRRRGAARVARHPVCVRATLKRGETRLPPRRAAPRRPRRVDCRRGAAATGGSGDRADHARRAGRSAGPDLPLDRGAPAGGAGPARVRLSRRTARSCGSGPPTPGSSRRPGTPRAPRRTSGALAVSLFGGEITVESLDLRASVAAGSVSASGNVVGLDVTGLTVLGQLITPPRTSSSRSPTGEASRCLGSRSRRWQKPPRSASASVTALRVKLIADHGGFAAGSVIEIGAVTAAATAAPAVDAPDRQPTTPARDEHARRRPVIPPDAPREPGTSIPGAPARARPARSLR